MKSWAEIKSKLFVKPDWKEYIILFLLVSLMLMGLAYRHDIATCADVVRYYVQTCIAEAPPYDLEYKEYFEQIGIDNFTYPYEINESYNIT